MVRSTVTHAAIAVAAITLTGPAALAAALQLNLTNGASRDLDQFYASPAGTGAAENLLGGAFLPAGNSVAVTIAADDSECVYDLRFVFTTGDPAEDLGVDVCQNGNYTLSD